MEDQKRVQLAVGLSLVVLVGWTFLSNKFSPPPTPPATPAVTSAPAIPATPALAADGTAAAANPTIANPATALPEEHTVIDMPGLYRVELTNYGAGITSFEIHDPKYFSRDARRLVLENGQVVAKRRNSDGPSELMGSYRPAMGVRLPDSGLTLPPVQTYKLLRNQLLSGGRRVVVYSLETSELILAKTYVFSPGSYQIDVKIELQNRKTVPVS